MPLKDKSNWELNMDAIVEYFNRQEPRTSKAAKLKDKFAQFHANIGWYDKYVDSDDTMKKAQNLRHQFDEANAISAKEKAEVERVRKTGLRESDVIPDLVDPSARTTEGYDVTAKEGFLTTKGKIALASLLVIGGAGYVAIAYPLVGLAVVRAPGKLLKQVKGGKKEEEDEETRLTSGMIPSATK